MIRGAVVVAGLLGGLGGVETARAASAEPPPIRFAAPADTDSVAVGARDTTEAADTVEQAPRDSVASAPDSTRADTLDTESEGPPFPDPDDVLERLAGLSGFRVIEYRGRDVQLDVQDEQVRLIEDAQATYAATVIDADTISYWAGLQYVQARRNITLQGEGQDVTSDSILNYDVSQTKGTIMDARSSFSEQGAEWFIRGDITPRGSHTIFAETSIFTSCEAEHPHYYFRAGQIKVVTNHIIVAWPVTLYINDVPIAWLPFFAQDIRDDRRSGFLPPRFGVSDVVSTSNNVRRSVSDFGYYLALNDFMDAQATMDWFSGRFTRVNTGFRYKNLKKFFQGSVLASYSFGNEKTFEFRMQHRHDLTPVTNIRVNANFISNTRNFERQSFNPARQTQRIASDIGFQHRFPFASINLSGSRRQDLGQQSGSTDVTLPNFQMTFSPVTLFRAPRNRSGLFNNIVVTGAFSGSRVKQNRAEAANLTTDRATANSSIRLGSFGISGNANYNRRTTLPFDSLVAEPDPTSVTQVDYGASADYQVDLIGSTTFRPTVRVGASTFRSGDTGDQVIAAPTRLFVGATLSTDVYGFLPGFGPFERIRHKFSPRFNFDYSPAVEAPDSVLSIPGFPVSNSRKQNRLSVTLNQTFEAKLREDVVLDEEASALLEGRSLDSLGIVVDSTGLAFDSAGVALDPFVAVGDSAGLFGAPPDSVNTGEPTRAQPRRNVVLLGINSSPLEFDFARENEPLLTTERWNHRINSDLLRGLSLNLALDLFEGVGEERSFSPILSSLTGSFTFSSASGLGGLLGLGGGGSRTQPDPRQRLRDGVDSRYRLQSFDENPDPLDPGLRSGGPWTLSLTYSLQRGRETESTQDRQSLNAILSLNPTPNWRLSWRTSYNLSEGEFGEHLVTLDRDLHRWMATFVFARAPNGNFIFQMSVNLRDAPDLKFDYDQQTLDR